MRKMARVIGVLLALAGIVGGVSYAASNPIGALVGGAVLIFGGLTMTTFIRSDITGAGVDIPNR